MIVFGPIVKYIVSQIDLLGHVDKRLNIIENILQDAYPNEWVINERSEEAIESVKKQYNLPADIDTAVSKNDLMFRYFVIHGFSLAESFRMYFTRTVHFYDLVSKASEKKWGAGWQTKTIPFLDFASGYGAFERLLVKKLDANQIYTSDIKHKAVDFQTERFGIKGIYSSYIPEEFNSPTKFKFIFVGSLFSHLPDDLFKRWLKKLWECTDDDGILMFSVHDNSLRNINIDFYYEEASEDTSMSNVEDSITKKDSYGSSFVSERYVASQLSDLSITTSQYGRYPRAFCGLQDIYIVSKEYNIFDKTLQFQKF
jgi:SAM-dependent methyltransferase